MEYNSAWRLSPGRVLFPIKIRTAVLFGWDRSAFPAATEVRVFDRLSCSLYQILWIELAYTDVLAALNKWQ